VDGRVAAIKAIKSGRREEGIKGEKTNEGCNDSKCFRVDE
jgi:hypothetical protein